MQQTFTGSRSSVVIMNVEATKTKFTPPADPVNQRAHSPQRESSVTVCNVCNVYEHVTNDLQI